ncbi:hypothetical protein CC80DRAFT_314235 [Byssothecium circinans]|uniref:Uncharacterized protein n=1 Tax=Byssothecium circinans TaxID=147558 RepID=A0A6A5U7N4_9PLEO|nr:hypothetical protein CC80DRAFT_314235 [Byssothecium circinans]
MYVLYASASNTSATGGFLSFTQTADASLILTPPILACRAASLRVITELTPSSNPALILSVTVRWPYRIPGPSSMVQLSQMITGTLDAAQVTLHVFMKEDMELMMGRNKTATPRYRVFRASPPSRYPWSYADMEEEPSISLPGLLTRLQT